MLSKFEMQSGDREYEDREQVMQCSPCSTIQSSIMTIEAFFTSLNVRHRYSFATRFVTRGSTPQMRLQHQPSKTAERLLSHRFSGLSKVSP